MESYDISNTNGYESVASMIVYEDGKPKRNNYRKFKIKTVQGPDDYASMEEVLTRGLNMVWMKEKKWIWKATVIMSWEAFQNFRTFF